MAYCIMFLRIPERDTQKGNGNVLVNALHASHRFNRRYHVKNLRISLFDCYLFS